MYISLLYIFYILSISTYSIFQPLDTPLEYCVKHSFISTNLLIYILFILSNYQEECVNYIIHSVFGVYICKNKYTFIPKIVGLYCLLFISLFLCFVTLSDFV